MPIYLLIAGAAAVALYFATRTSTPSTGPTQGLTGPGNPVEGSGGSGQPLVGSGHPLVGSGQPLGSPPNPATGPQALFREDKIGLMMMLAGTNVASVSSDKLGDVGVLMTDGVSLPSKSSTTAPATDVLKNASMAGHAILAKKGEPAGASGSPTLYLLVATPGTEALSAAPGSDWFIFLQPKEFDAIAKLAGADASGGDGLKMGPGPGGMGREVFLPGDGGKTGKEGGKTGKEDGKKTGEEDGKKTDKFGFTPTPGNPFRKLAIGAPTGPSKDPTPDDAHLDWTALPTALKMNVQKAVDSGDWHTVVAWADNARDGGYTVAAQQLYDMARADGWMPSDGDHPGQMTFLEMIAPYSHPHIIYQNQLVNDGPTGRVVVPDGWVESIQTIYHRAGSAPMPNDEADLRNSASMVAAAGYTKASAELTALASVLNPPKPKFGSGDGAPGTPAPPPKFVAKNVPLSFKAGSHKSRLGM